MQYTISDDGTLYSNTNLTGFTAEALLEFPLPKNRTFVESIVSGYRITKEDVQKTLKRGLKTLSDAESIIKVLKQNVEQIIFDSDVDEKSRKRFLRLLNKHEHFRMSEKHKQSALKNFIVHKIVSVIQDPKNQINVLTPVHTNKIKAASKNSALGLREKHLSLLTPTTTMIMQDQNMIGKTSIASSATGEKVYFHVLNYYSTEMMRLRNLVYQEGSVAIPSIIAKLNELTFINPIYSEITLIGNTSVNPLIRALGTIRDVDLSHYSIEIPGKFEAFKNEDGTLNLSGLLRSLHNNSNKTNCSEDNSEMVTTSTDNAKELDLKKINAIPETLDIFTYLISTGVDLKDVLNFMKQPVMKVCVDFAKSSMFMPWVGSWNQFDQVVKFVKNEDSLWGPDSNLFKREITNMIDFWNPVATKYKIVQDAMIKLGIPLEAKVDYKMLPRFMKLFELNIPGINLQELFLNHLKAKINEAKIRLKNSANIDFDQINPEDMEQMVTNTTYLDIQKHIDLYKYFKYTVIPKINSIRTILADVYIKKDESFSDYFDRLNAEYQSRISDPLNQLSNILLGVREQKFLGFAFSINKGLATSDFDEYEWVAKFNQRVNTIIYDHSQKPENSSKKFEAFDLLKFIKDEKYRDDQILQMEGMKHTYNVLKVIVEAEHTWNRIKSIGVLRDVVSTIGIFKFERDVVTRLLRQDVVKITQQHTKRLSQNEWKAVRNYARSVFVWNWFARQSDLKVDLLEGQIGFSSLMDKEPNVLIESKTMSLDNELGLANFKLFVETELLLYLKEKYKDNQFIQKLITGGITDKSGRVINFLKLPFSLSDVEGNSTYETLYSNILNDFNRIMFDKIEHENFKNHNWTIGDLFFVYNLYVNKESAGSDTMLKLFEDNVLYGNQLTTAKSYYDYLSAIDKWGVMDENNPNGVEIKYQLEDLVYALRYSGEYRASIFGATTLTPNKVEIPNSKSPKITSSPGYFLFNMPYLLNKDGLRFDLKSPTTISVKNMRSKYSPNLENRSTIRTIVEHMVKILGNKANVPIKVVDKFELEQLFGDDNVNVLANQKGFIKNGIVYINLEEATLDTPIHELAHIICAGMKYSLNSTVRSAYYTLLKQVDDESLLPYLDDFDENDYTNKHLSDIREEKLVRILSAHLKGAFAKEWSGLFTEEISPNDLSSAIAKTLFTILKITDVSEQEFLGETGVEFGRATLETILKSFNSKLFSLSEGWLNTGVVIKSQRVATIKDRLIKLANLTIEGDC